MSKSKEQQIDAFPVPIRGRPVTGTAMTAAERKRRQRAKHKQGVFRVNNDFDPTGMPVGILLELLSACVSKGDIFRVKRIQKELLKRAENNVKNR